MGDGLKHEAGSFYPVKPPMIMDDPPFEKECGSEPNPLYEDQPVQDNNDA